MANFNAMDVWQIVCYLTIFSSVIEYCFVMYLTKTATWEENLITKNKVDVFDRKETQQVCVNLILHRKSCDKKNI